MKTTSSKDGNYEIPREQKYYLSTNGKIDKSFKGNKSQCDRQAKSYRDKGDNVEYIHEEEA